MSHKFHVSGMRCASCALLVEDAACGCAGVRSAKVDLARGTVTVEGDFGDKTPAQITEQLTEAVAAHGYRVLEAPPSAPAPKWGEFRIALPVAAALVIGFLWLQRAGLVNLIGAGELSYGGVFLVGAVASLSSCLAVVGGLALSVSAAYAKVGERVRPQVAFHAARLAAFFVLGGAVGALGAAISPGPVGSAILGLLVGVAMLALGLNLLDVFPWARRFQLRAPRALSRGALKLGAASGWLAPVALGAATFVLPCGFTQSMQLYALSRGSFLDGGLTMLVFALGTLPMLAAVSFLPAAGKIGTGVAMKVAGLLAIAFALINVAGSLIALGLIPPVLNF
jgi:sulfite exporter TauE/SafE/copper chaperone CopZ